MYERIAVDPNQMNSEPCIRHLRIPVATILTMMGQGMDGSKMLAYYPDLEKEDILEALNYAAEAMRERELPLKRKTIQS